MKIKSQNKSEAIQKICYELRGNLNGQYIKKYILHFILYLFLSEKLSNLITQRETINYIDLSDDKIKNELIKKYVDELGYFLYPSELFCNVLKNARDNENLNETLETIFKNIEKTIHRAIKSFRKNYFSSAASSFLAFLAAFGFSA